MELIPILSLIILVATISTFILGVGAYILYKIREGKSRSSSAQPASVQAELVSPVPIMAEQSSSRTGRTRSYTTERPGSREKYQEPIYAPAQDNVPQMRPTFVEQQGQTFVEASRYQYQATTDNKQNTARRFTRYTTAEHFPKTEPEKKQVDEKETLKWR